MRIDFTNVVSFVQFLLIFEIVLLNETDQESFPENLLLALGQSLWLLLSTSLDPIQNLQSISNRDLIF